MDFSRRGFIGYLAALSGGALASGKIPVATATEPPHPTPTPAPAAATRYSTEAFELAEVKWFDNVRGFGSLTGLSSGHGIFVHPSVVKNAGIEEFRMGMKVAVHWKSTSKGPMAQDIRNAVL